MKNFLGATLALSSCVCLAQSANKEPSLTQAQVAEDIDVFRRDFLAADVSYAPKARADAENRLKALNGAERNFGAFSLEICRIVALADNGHTQCRLSPVPTTAIQFMPMDGNYYVVAVEAKSAASLLGAQLSTIDDQPVKKIAEAGFRLRGGVTAQKEYFFADILRTPARLYSLGFSATTRGVMYRFTSRTGATIEQRFVAGDTMPEMAWITPPDRVPWSQQNPEQPFRWVDAPASNAVIIQLRRNSDAPGGQRIADFLQDAEANRTKLGRRNVILDMRFNSGGDLLTTRGFFVEWPGRVPENGRIYVLQGPRTFSAGITSIAYLKQAGGKRVVLIGQPPGDRMMFFAEGKDVMLPNSGITVSPSLQRHDYRDGCKKYDDCFAAVAQPNGRAVPSDVGMVRMPITLKDLEPDVEVKPTLKDLLDGRDATMEAATAQIARNSK